MKRETHISRADFLSAIASNLPTEEGAISISSYIDRGQVGIERIEIKFPIVIRYGNDLPFEETYSERWERQLREDKNIDRIS